MNKYISYLLVIYLGLSMCLSSHILGSKKSKEYIFKAYQGKHHLYTMYYHEEQLLLDGKPAIRLKTKRASNIFFEENTCWLNNKSEMISLQQEYTTFSSFEKEIWEIDNTQEPAKAVFFIEDKQEKKPISFVYPKRGQSFQSLIYVLQRKITDAKAKFDIKFLLPPYFFYEMEAKVIDTQEVVYEETNELCYKVEIGIKGPLRAITPTIFFWLKAMPPHIPVKYQDNTVTAYLVRKN